MKSEILHKPVMAREVIEHLNLRNGYKVLDATVGCGSHADLILDNIKPDGLLIGIDQDKKSLDIARAHLDKYKNTILRHANFKDIASVFLDLGIDKINAALFDLGISSYQLEGSGRGFSFSKDEPLDMRMDESGLMRAYEIVNRHNRLELERIIRDFGQERYYRRIVGFILEKRRTGPINTTEDLKTVIIKAVGRRYRAQKIHPATRTFQALRIAVNSELENLEKVLGTVIGFLESGARLCVISFHSLEDRIVKIRFKEFKASGKANIITKKPLVPDFAEIKENPRARSAKMRVLEKI